MHSYKCKNVNGKFACPSRLFNSIAMKENVCYRINRSDF